MIENWFIHSNRHKRVAFVISVCDSGACPRTGTPISLLIDPNSFLKPEDYKQVTCSTNVQAITHRSVVSGVRLDAELKAVCPSPSS